MNIYFGSNQSIEPNYLFEANKLITSLNQYYSWFKRPLYSIWEDTNQVSETIVNDGKKFLVIFDGYLNNISGSVFENLPFLARRIIQEQKILEADETGIFNISVIDKDNGNVYLAGDPGALFPLYYIQLKHQFYFFSHMYIFADAFGLKPDYTGILTKLKFGYTFGSRTLYQSLSRLNPGCIVKFDNTQKTITTIDSEAYFTVYKDYGRDLIEETWNSINKPFVSYSKYSKKIGIMLSEGFDSRLVAGLASGAGLDLSTYTHGTPGTRGADITFRVAELLSAEYFFNPLNNGLPANEEQLKKQLYLSDNLSIPYWIDGSQYFSSSGVDIVTAGTALDSTLGGHPFYRPARPRVPAVTQRYKEVILQNTGLLTEKYIEILSADLLNNFLSASTSRKILQSILESLNSEIIDQLKTDIENVREDLVSELKRVSLSTENTFSLSLVKFYLENRARKFSFGQELTLRINNRLVTPSYEPIPMRVLSKIHPKHKLHHKLYISVVNSYLPDLYKIPYGGFGLPTNFPRLLLESSRFIHKYIENKTIDQYIARKGDMNINNLRAVNFFESTYRKGAAIDFFINFFKQRNGIFNSTKLVNKLLDVKNYQSKSFLVMESYNLFEVTPPLNHL